MKNDVRESIGVPFQQNENPKNVIHVLAKVLINVFVCLQIYQVAYIVVKAANAPRPGNWILEKSLDGVNYEPWQYFSINDDDCRKLYNISASPGKPSYDYLRDDEVRCTSYFSKLNPLENGEVNFSRWPL